MQASKATEGPAGVANGTLADTVHCNQHTQQLCLGAQHASQANSSQQLPPGLRRVKEQAAGSQARHCTYRALGGAALATQHCAALPRESWELLLQGADWASTHAKTVQHNPCHADPEQSPRTQPIPAVAPALGSKRDNKAA